MLGGMAYNPNANAMSFGQFGPQPLTQAPPATTGLALPAQPTTGLIFQPQTPQQLPLQQQTHRPPLSSLFA